MSPSLRLCSLCACCLVGCVSGSVSAPTTTTAAEAASASTGASTVSASSSAGGTSGSTSASAATGASTSGSTGRTDSYATAVLADDPIAFYRLDETSGTVAKDSSGHQIDGTYGADVALGGTGVLPGDPDPSAAFNGGAADPTNYVQVPANSLLQPATAVSIELWMNASAAGNSAGLVSYGEDATSPWQPYILQLAGQNVTLSVVVSGVQKTLTSHKQVSLNAPHYVVGTFDGATLSLYLDGTLDSQAGATGTVSNYGGSNGLGIGHRFTSSQPVLKGSIGDVAVYGVALTVAQVAGHFAAGGGATGATTSTSTSTSTTTTTGRASTTSTSTASTSTSSTGGTHGGTTGGTTSGTTSGTTGGTTMACSPALGTYTNNTLPPVCFVANGSQSPLQVRLPAQPHYDPNDATYVANLMTQSTEFILQSRTPSVFSVASDPVYTLHCTEPWGTCGVEGKQVHIANGATVEGGGDAHLTVLDQALGLQVDMWGTDSSMLNTQGGALNCLWGGMDVIGGEGLECGAIAANFCQYGLTVHINELLQGVIEHPLQLGIPCEDGPAVYPSTGVEVTCKNGINTYTGTAVVEPQPHLGMLFALDYTDAEIAAMHLPSYQAAVITALAHYGAFITDTGSGGWSPGLLLMHEDTAMYTNYGIDPWGDFFTANGLSDDWDITSGVDIKDHLHLIDSCELQHNCN